MSAQSAVNWYWNRLRCMSPAEMVHRFRRALAAQVERYGLGNTASVSAPDLSIKFQHFVNGGDDITAHRYAAAADEILAGRIRIFALDCVLGPVPRWNKDPKSGREAPLVFGNTLNYRNEWLVGDIKYLWEPNRHLHLVTLAQAWRLTADRRYLDGIGRHIESWIDQCPHLMGPNWTGSLELAIRLINWSIVWQLIGGLESPLFQNEHGRRLRDRWLRAIYQHLRFVRGHLSRFSSANNHLIGEVAGLFVGTITWPYWRECRTWAQEAKDILEEEASRQNGVDGVNREQAISYQQFVLDFLLLSALAGRANALHFSEQFWKRIESMIEYLASVMDVGSHVPMIGDADDGYVVRLSQEPHFCPYRSLLASGAVLFGRAAFKAKAAKLDDKTRWLLGIPAEVSFRELADDRSWFPVRREFPDGGYYIVGCDFQTKKEIRMVVDTGPLGYLSIAAHGHADALAVTLSVGGREFLVDPGTYAYHTKKKWRNYFRGTAAHNTIVVDNQDQSVTGGNFMWLQKANAHCDAWVTAPAEDRITTSHDGYLRLADPVSHRRQIVLDKRTRRICITDTLECRASHRAQCMWHFSEACDVVLDENSIVATNEMQSIRLIIRNPEARLDLHRAQSDPPRGWVSRRFDIKVPATTASATINIQGTTSIVTEIVCD